MKKIFVVAAIAMFTLTGCKKDDATLFADAKPAVLKALREDYKPDSCQSSITVAALTHDKAAAAYAAKDCGQLNPDSDVTFTNMYVNHRDGTKGTKDEGKVFTYVCGLVTGKDVLGDRTNMQFVTDGDDYTMLIKETSTAGIANKDIREMYEQQNEFYKKVWESGCVPK